MKRPISLLLTLCLFSINALAYGPHGHQLVGAVADKRLAKNPTVKKKVRQLLDGLTLEQVATFPDEIKSWDDCGRPPSNRPVTSKTRINNELRAFLNANLCSSHPSHHEFHFTDVPVFGNEKYADGEIGREPFDIVKMIPFCIRVLKGEEPETNDRAITKSIAVILLAHYLGDIHQPLHVGAEYFNADGDPFEPSTSNKGFADQGGNKLTLFTFVGGKLKSAGKFHSYWDGRTVDNAFGTAANSTVARQLAARAPAGWKLNGDPETWAEQMANDILPLAREAHERLDFVNIKIETGAHDIKSGQAKEKKKTGGKSYTVWSAGVVKKEIQKGGWRLAALLEETLQ
ncbi:MAG TPA: S1/P1 nuclease [Pyrinomonadaceae bacterium]